MTSINNIVLESADPTAAATFYDTAFGLGSRVQVRASDAPTEGFRGYTMSLVVSQPSGVDALMDAALTAGATELKPATKSFWGYGAAVQAPDGAIWTLASSSKKNSGPVTRDIDDIVLLLGVDDVKATKQFYVDRGFPVGKSFGGKYVELATNPIKLALYGRGALAKNAGVSPEGSGSHRLVIRGDAGSFADPDGFDWEVAAR